MIFFGKTRIFLIYLNPDNILKTASKAETALEAVLL